MQDLQPSASFGMRKLWRPIMRQDPNFEDFCKHTALFRDFNHNELKALYEISKEKTLEKGEYLMEEGDPGNEFFFVMEGDLEVVKHDLSNKQDFVIGTIHPGDTVGEMALFDSAPRSASIRATTHAKLRGIAFADLRKLANENKEISSIYSHLSKNLSQRVRTTSDIAFNAMKKEMEEYKIRTNIGQFFVHVLVAFSLIIYSLGIVKYLLKIVPNSTYITIPMILFLGIFTYFIIRSSHFPLSVFGITTNKWKQALFEGIVWTIPVAGLVVVVKLLCIRYLPDYQGHSVFEPFILMSQSDKTLKYWIYLNLAYWLFVPAQELMARGTLQSLLEKFLISKHSVLSAVIVSNLLFGIAHFFMSEQVGIMIFMVGLYMGFLYANTHNLLGPIVAHCLIGTWSLSVVGFVIG